MFIIFLILGVILFGIFLNKLGKDALLLITQNFSLKYLLIYSGITLCAFAPLVWRWKVILSAYNIKISFWTLLRIQLAGYCISYITPSARIGGEPLKIYMLNKECNVDLKTGTSSVIMDRYLELIGSIFLGLIGVIIFLFMPEISISIKLILGGLITISLIIIFFFYYRLAKNKGFFSSILKALSNIKRHPKVYRTLLDIDNQMSDFIINKKKEFFYSLSFYFLSGFLFILEFKYALLSFGITSTLTELILIVIMIGIVIFIPVPMALGFLEGGQTALFNIIKGDGNIGMALSLIHRMRGIIISLIGFLLIIQFSGLQILEEYKKPRHPIN